MYSALKHQGKRLYQLAREGRQVERKARRVTIYQLTLLSCSGDSLSFDVSCSKGTYIRTLAEDIGAVLGCGAHLTALRRTAVDSFVEQDGVTIEQLQVLEQQGRDQLDALLMPVTRAVMQFPELTLDVSSCLRISQGKRVQLDAFEATGLCRLVTAEGRFIGLGKVAPDGELAAKRLMNTAR
jgi:tRNA pseudouridine55 synthase